MHSGVQPVVRVRSASVVQAALLPRPRQQENYSMLSVHKLAATAYFAISAATAGLAHRCNAISTA